MRIFAKSEQILIIMWYNPYPTNLLAFISMDYELIKSSTCIFPKLITHFSVSYSWNWNLN